MALYSYKAIDSAGKSAKGLQDAANLIDLEQRLKRAGLDLISGKEEENRASFGSSKIKRTDLITFFFNLEQLVRAGVPLLECLGDLRDTMEEATFREIIASMVESIESGKKLSQAMAEHPNAFDKITVSLTRAGEDSGRLVEVFAHLTESLKWQDEMASQTKTMMIYPAFVGTVVLAITFFLMIYLVPQLVSFIKGMGQDIPIQTRMLLATSSFFVHYWYVLLLTPPVLFGTYKVALISNPGLQYHVDNLKLHIWPTGPILRKIILARFANTFAMMYSSGITILDCIANSRDLVNNQVIANSLQNVMREIEAGKNLTQSFQQTGIFPPLVVRMLKVGEATGQLDQALLNVSYFYDRDVKDSIKKVQALIEPTMTIVLGALLGWVMLSVLSPIYDIISKVKM
ncbi:type II secretion system F family protein [Sideroxydans lithotrophicus]|uniref:Type II secretion system F domain protein n=1 Tax=Sideroxydans lithotrophicus (strain ES-1) TaxID=580332 RepID=D5CNL0_SIDLE|nr:type II secretion system F family protein [Sideroxydans lithotrophicus]ADE10923.1 Type II secretion system F domain protein [Sideroxydans lithotrophicus ES-1]